MGSRSQADLDNHANQLNPNNSAYWSSRGGSGDGDDDESYSAGPTWSPSYSPSYAPVRQKELRVFTMEAVTVQGEVQRTRVSVECWPEHSAESAAQRATQRMHEHCWSWSRRPRPQVAFWRVLDSFGTALFQSRPVQLQLRGLRAEQVTQALVRKMLRTIDFRRQSDEALAEYKGLVQEARRACEALSSAPPMGCRAATWTRLRADLIERFTPPSTTSPCDFRLAREELRRLGVDSSGIASYARAEELRRRHDVLLRASIHRSPPPDPDTGWVGSDRPDAFVEYFKRTGVEEQLQVLSEWFSKGQPAVSRLMKSKPRKAAKEVTDLGTIRMSSW